MEVNKNYSHVEYTFLNISCSLSKGKSFFF